MTTTNPTLKLRDVGKWYPGPKDPNQKVHILRDINLDVHTGEIITVVGSSGCGKSTLLAGIGGFNPFNVGKASIHLQNGQWKPLGKPDRHRGIVFQDYPVPEFLTAQDNVALGPNFKEMNLLENFLPFLGRKRKKAHRETAEQFLQKVGLQDHKHKYPRELSGGQRQRVAIAQSLAMQPEILLMDEPFSGLDPTSRENLQTLVKTIHKELRNTIFFVTHDLEEAIYLGNRIIVLGPIPTETPGATIIHEQTLEEFKTPESKGTQEFAELTRYLRTKFQK